MEMIQQMMAKLPEYMAALSVIANGVLLFVAATPTEADDRVATRIKNVYNKYKNFVVTLGGLRSVQS